VDVATLFGLAGRSRTQRSEGQSMKVKVKGAARKIDMIFRFDKELWKNTTQIIRASGGEVASDAKSRIPAQGLTNWGLWWEFPRGRDLSYDSGRVQAISVSVRSRQVQGFRRIKAKVGFSKGNAAGAIFGLAGSVPGTQSQFDFRSDNFKRAMLRKHGGSMGARNNQTWPRALTPAYYAKGPRARERIGAAIQRMVNAVNR
jgi:hypothetical protein